jgi:hypothetical protein
MSPVATCMYCSVQVRPADGRATLRWWPSESSRASEWAILPDVVAIRKSETSVSCRISVGWRLSADFQASLTARLRGLTPYCLYALALAA